MTKQYFCLFFNNFFSFSSCYFLTLFVYDTVIIFGNLNTVFLSDFFFVRYLTLLLDITSQSNTFNEVKNFLRDLYSSLPGFVSSCPKTLCRALHKATQIQRTCFTVYATWPCNLQDSSVIRFTLVNLAFRFQWPMNNDTILLLWWLTFQVAIQP